MKKHLIMCLLIFFVISAAIPVGAGTDSAIFELSVPHNLPKAGEKFEVSVELSNNPGFCAVQFMLAYNSDVMICDDVIIDERLSGAISATNPEGDGGAIVAAASLKTFNGDGPVAHYLFTAKENIETFEFKLKDIVFADENNKDIQFIIAGDYQNADLPTNPDNEPDIMDEIIVKPDDAVNEEPSEDTSVSEQPSSGGEYDGAEQETEPEKNDKEDSIDRETVSEHTFPDISGHYAESYIIEAAKLGLFIGDTNGCFNPDEKVTRAQFVTVLWRMSERPVVDVELPFLDTDGQIPEFISAIKWGFPNGYIKGTSDTTFEPEEAITREAAMKILHGYSGDGIGSEIQFYPIYNSTFKDSTDISEWAKSSVYWGIYNKLISGTSPETLSPKEFATRAQLAKILINQLDIN